MALWQTVGFCHGVLNTDNMSILGITLDYGPFGFMEYFNRDHICNTSDDSGRYSYANQPAMCRWNCSKLLEALSGISVPCIFAFPVLLLLIPILWLCVMVVLCTYMNVEFIPSEEHETLLKCFDEEFEQSYEANLRKKLGTMVYF